MKASLLLLAGLVGCTTLPNPEPPPQRPKEEADAPEISRSGGDKGGVVILWPRIVPKTDSAEMKDYAAKLQEHIKGIVEKQLPGRPVDVRPEPERVCPRAGCAAATVGILFTRDGTGCAAAALISGPGASPAKIVPWIGAMQLRRDEVPFREPPESSVKVHDFAKCSDMLATGDDAKIAAAIHALGAP